MEKTELKTVKKKKTRGKRGNPAPAKNKEGYNTSGRGGGGKIVNRPTQKFLRGALGQPPGGSFSRGRSPCVGVFHSSTGGLRANQARFGKKHVGPVEVGSPAGKKKERLGPSVPR